MATEDFTIDLGHDGEISARHYAPDPLVALRATYILAPGAMLGQDHAFIRNFGERLSDRGLDVVTFNFPFQERGRKKPDGQDRLEQCYRQVMDRVAATHALAGQPLLIGGKSMGGRIASFMAAQPEWLPQPVAGLIFLGYPLHAPQRPEQLRVAHLPDIRVPMLFVQGTRDAFGTAIQIEPIIAALEVPAALHKVMGGDHSFALPRRYAGAEPRVFGDAAIAIVNWVAALIQDQGQDQD